MLQCRSVVNTEIYASDQTAGHGLKLIFGIA